MGNLGGKVAHLMGFPSIHLSRPGVEQFPMAADAFL